LAQGSRGEPWPRFAMGFQENFGKEKEQLLNYDDSAWAFFSTAVLLLVGLPWTVLVLRAVFFPSVPAAAKKSAEGSAVVRGTTSLQVEQEERRREDARQWSRRLSVPIRIQLGVLLLLWSVFAYGFTTCLSTQMIRTFDPFEILQIEQGADDKSIKKAYRRLSLQYHPDKNKNDPMASANFMQISSAYKALTDEVAKKNYEKFGNPDGQSTMKMSVGLPRGLVKEENQLLVLAVFSILLLFAVPMAYLAVHMRQKKYSASGVIVDTLNFLGYVIGSHSRAGACAELLAASAESRGLALRARSAD